MRCDAVMRIGGGEREDRGHNIKREREGVGGGGEGADGFSRGKVRETNRIWGVCESGRINCTFLDGKGECRTTEIGNQEFALFGRTG